MRERFKIVLLVLMIFQTGCALQTRYKKSKPELFYFYTEWCNPCEKQTQIVRELKTTYTDIVFNIIDCDKEIPANLPVSSPVLFPSIILLKNGVVQNTIEGYIPKQELDKELKNIHVIVTP